MSGLLEAALPLLSARRTNTICSMSRFIRRDMLTRILKTLMLEPYEKLIQDIENLPGFDCGVLRLR